MNDEKGKAYLPGPDTSVSFLLTKQKVSWVGNTGLDVETKPLTLTLLNHTSFTKLLNLFTMLSYNSRKDTELIYSKP